MAKPGTHPRRRARAIAGAHARFVATGELDTVHARVREVVAGSWLRSSDAHVDPDTDPPVALADDGLTTYRSAHPLALVLPVLRDLVGGTADDGGHVWAVMDAAGRLLWVEGHRGARDRAARMNFVEGALWDEAHAGTNAPGTALAIDHEVQIFATEHFRHTVQDWTCAAAPIHDPHSGRILGVLDVTGGDTVAHPHSLALVRAAARVAEAHLTTFGQVPRAGDPALRLEVLGRPSGLLYLDGRAVRLNRRHAEALALLSLHPEGLSGQQLAVAIYDDRLADSTLRVELNRLRRIVGDLLRSRPYRLAAPVRSDLMDVDRALRDEDVSGAVRAYPGPLLPNSDAPGVVRHRRWLDTRLRSAVLTGRDPWAVYRWASGPGSTT